MSKPISIEDKTKVLDHYISRPNSVEHPEVLRAIKTDVLKANTKGTSRASEVNTDLYNKCMGLYRAFLKDRGAVLKLEGKKARIYQETMNHLIKWMQALCRENGSPDDDKTIEGLFFKLFKSWDRLNDFHRGQIALPDIYRNIEEIIPQIRNGNPKKSTISDSYKAQVLRDVQSEGDEN
jgi:hypothetical protein